MSFPFFKQLHAMDCGPTCLRMVAKYYGIDFHPDQMKAQARIKKEGSTMLDLVDAADELGLKATGMKITYAAFKLIPLPAILHWNNFHFVVLFKITRSSYWIADPAVGMVKLNRSAFIKNWQAHAHTDRISGIVLTFQLKEN